MRLSTLTRCWQRVAGLVAMTMAAFCGSVCWPVREMTAQSAAGGRIVEERTDPATGARWMLMRDAEHSAELAHWVLADAGRERPAAAGATTTEPKLVIHAGDKIVVQEETAVVNAWLEATALTGAKDGGELRVKLKIGGRILAVRAISPGTAEMKEETWP